MQGGRASESLGGGVFYQPKMNLHHGRTLSEYLDALQQEATPSISGIH